MTSSSIAARRLSISSIRSSDIVLLLIERNALEAALYQAARLLNIAAAFGGGLKHAVETPDALDSRPAQSSAKGGWNLSLPTNHWL